MRTELWGNRSARPGYEATDKQEQSANPSPSVAPSRSVAPAAYSIAPFHPRNVPCNTPKGTGVMNQAAAAHDRQSAVSQQEAARHSTGNHRYEPPLARTGTRFALNITNY